MEEKSPAPVRPIPYAEALGDQDPILVMATTPDRLRRLVRGLTEKQLSKQPLPGKWSIKEIIAHLADGEVIIGSRYRFVGAHDRPAIAGYDQDLFVARLGVANTTTQDLLDDFALARAVNLGLLERLPIESFDRVGIHSERGPESILTMVAFYSGHDLHHMAQIETIRVGLFGGAKKKVRKPAKKTAPAMKAPAKKAAPKVKSVPAKRSAPARKAAKKR